MSIAAFVVLLLVAGAAVTHPLLPSRRALSRQMELSDGDIEQAVRALRRRRTESGPVCLACGTSHQAGDRFCVRCGQVLYTVAAASAVCPNCQAVVRPTDQFCATCGRGLTDKGGA